jgi:hypothetical protein
MRPYERHVKCVVCGTEAKFWSTATCSMYGPLRVSNYLDQTPINPSDLSLQYCETCGYCANDIEDDFFINIEIVKKIIKSEKYHKIFSESDFSDANYFICNYMIEKAHGNYEGALESILNAIGYFEYYKKFESDELKAKAEAKAKEYRKVAAEYLEIIREKGKIIRQWKVILVDLHRRMGDFKKAKKLVKQYIKRGASDRTMKIFEFELKKIIEEDARGFTINDVFKGKEGGLLI